MKTLLAAGVGVLMVTTLFADEQRFVLALQRWEQQPCLISGLHVVTSGIFLAEDLAAL